MLDIKTTSKSEVKRFANKVLERLEKDGTSVTFPQMLEAVSTGFGWRDWNTFGAQLKDDKRLPLDSEQKKLGEPKVEQSSEQFLSNKQQDEHQIVDYDVFWDLGSDKRIVTSPASLPSKSTGFTLIQSLGEEKRLHWMNLLNLHFLSSSNLEKTTMGIVTSDKNQKKIFDYLQTIQPQINRDKILYKKLTVGSESAINPFDLPLGQSKPSPLQKKALITLLKTVSAPDYGSRVPENGMDDLSEMIVDLVYKREINNPRKVQDTLEALKNQNQENKILNSLTESIVSFYKIHRIDLPTTWKECSDQLAEKEETELAKFAQSLAVPIMRNVADEINYHNDISSEFGKLLACNGQALTKMLDVRLASLLQDYPALGKRTAISFHNKQWVAFDVSDLCIKYQENNKIPRIASLIATQNLYQNNISSDKYENARLNLYGLSSLLGCKETIQYLFSLSRDLQKESWDKSIVMDTGSVYSNVGGYATLMRELQQLKHQFHLLDSPASCEELKYTYPILTSFSFEMPDYYEGQCVPVLTTNNGKKTEQRFTVNKIFNNVVSILDNI